MQNLLKKNERIQAPIFYGWIIVVIASLGIFFSGPGQTYSVSVFIDSYIQEFGWSRSFVSSLYSLATLTSGLLLFFIGRLIDRRGHRLMMPTIAILFSIACLFMSRISHFSMLLIGFFLVRFLGQGSMTLLSSTLVPQWFISKRGKALSFMALGGALSSTLLPPINTWIISGYGWRAGWLFWALLLGTVMVPAALLVRNKPEDMGLLPDNDTIKKNTFQKEKIEIASFTVKEAKGTRTFWLLLFCMFVSAMSNTGMTFHLFSILGERGLPPMETAMILSAIALVSLPSSFIAGYLLDHYRSNHIIAFTFATHLLVILSLLRATSFHGALFFGVLWGVCAGFESMNYNYIWPSFYGRLYLGSIRGLTMTAMVIGSAFGPLPFGFFYDLFGGYSEILGVLFFFTALAIFSSLFAVMPKKDNYNLKAPKPLS